MTNTIQAQRQIVVGEEYRLLPGPWQTAGGGGVYFDTTVTTVRVLRYAEGNNDCYAVAVDGPRAGQHEQTIAIRFLDLGDPWAQVDSWVRDYLRTNTLRRDGGEIARAGAMREQKVEMLVQAFRLLAMEYRANNAVFDSYRAAGSRFWTLVTEVSGQRGVTWQRRYHNDVTACEQIGEWAYGLRSEIVALPEPATTARRGMPTMLPPTVAAGALLVHQDGSLWKADSESQQSSAETIRAWRYDPQGVHIPTRAYPTTDFVRVLNEGDRIRRNDARDGTYNNRRFESGQEYEFVAAYSTGDRAIYVREVGGTGRGTYTCHGMFTADTTPNRRPIVARDEAWRIADGVLCWIDSVDDNGTLRVYDRTSGDWRNQRDVQRDTLFVAEEGDRARLAVDTGHIVGGTVVEYLRTGGRDGSRDAYIRIPGDTREVVVDRRHLTYVGAGAASTRIVLTPEQATRVIDGVEYVRKDVVEQDMAHATKTLHRGADENGLCAVYDRTARQVDEGTILFKMGERPRTRVVRIRETYTVDRWVTVPDARGEEPARRAAEGVLDRLPVVAPDPEGANNYRTGTVTRTNREVVSNQTA